ncbi:MAG: D-alanine--D-alanine ligase, partial [Bacteroidales bacterium]|nr:D-alanine--D-alanine ligase [Bacteroidales bacterium]
GNSQEICPAPVEESFSAHIQEVTKRIYTHLGCKGVVRMDYINGEDGLYFLEVNTIPGMTSASLVPKMVRTAGIDITDFLSGIIENS